MKKRFLIISSILLIFNSALNAATLKVPDEYPDIMMAVRAANEGDTVLIADGVYKGNGNRDLHVSGDITVRGENGPEKCIIDCNGTELTPHRGMEINGSATIDGITIINGYAERGGAIFVEDHDNHLRIINCVLKNNTASEQGGAIFCEYANVEIFNTKLFENTSQAGGAIFCERAKLYLSKSSIKKNKAVGDGWISGGGGICGWQESEITLQDCEISENVVESEREACGGGIRCEERCSLNINNSRIESNNSQGMHEAKGGGVFCREDVSLTINDTKIADNLCIGEWSGGGGLYFERGNKCVLAGCVIENNITKNRMARRYQAAGGGLYLQYAKNIITKCVITNNDAAIGAGAFFGLCDSIVWGCLISGNKNSQGAHYYYTGAAYASGGSAKFINCTVIGNNYAGFHFRGTDAEIKNSIVYYNGGDMRKYHQIMGDADVSYCCVSDIGHCDGQGNIDSDPCFVVPGYWDANGTEYNWEDDFWVEGDYRLKDESDCVNAGGPACYMFSDTDLADMPRLVADRIDMGAYENQTLPCIEAKLAFMPNVINPHSRRRHVFAMVTMPKGIRKADINMTEKLVMQPGGIEAARQFAFEYKKGDSYLTYILAVFNKQRCLDSLNPGENEVEITGMLNNERCFSASAILRIPGRSG